MKKFKHEKYIRELLEFTPTEWVDKYLPHTKGKMRDVLYLIIYAQHITIRNQLLALNDDTILREKVSKYLRIAKDEGFRIILEFPFTGFNEEITKEFLYVLWNDELGILLKFDTLNMATVKSCCFYYNWKPNIVSDYMPGIMADGHFLKDGTWVGDHDGQEALRLKIKLLREHGNFILPWKKIPDIYLCHYVDDKKISDKITKKRFKLIDDNVCKECIRI